MVEQKTIYLKIGLVLSLLGLFITLVGFSLSGWNIQAYRQEDSSRAWYRMVNFEPIPTDE